MGDQIIEVPGHGQIAFPDSMSDQDIIAAIKKITAPAVPDVEKPGAISRFISGTGIPGYFDAMTKPSADSQSPTVDRIRNVIGYLGTPTPDNLKNAFEMVKGMGSASIDHLKAADEFAKQGDYKSALGHQIYAIPGIGEMGYQISNKIHEGDYAGASGGLAALLGPRAIEAAPRIGFPKSTPKPYNAMEPGMRVPVAPPWAESVPVAGKFAKLYNIGAKVVNSSNEPRVVQVPGNPAPIPMDHPLARLKGEARSSGMPAPPAQPINDMGRLQEAPQGRSSGIPAPPIEPTRSFRQRMASSAAANEEALSEPANVVARIKALSEPEPAPAPEMPPVVQKFSKKFKAADPVEEAVKNPYAAKARAPKTAALVDLLKQMGFSKRDWELMSEGQRQSVANRAGFNFDDKLSPQTISAVHAGLEQ